MKLWLKVLIGVVVVLSLIALYLFNPRLPVPGGEASAALYAPGNLGVTREAISLVDESRPTAANGDFAGSPVRELDGYVWYPKDVSTAPFPLIVYSHGFMSSVAEPGDLVAFLVPKGYVVVAVNHPLSHGGAPGGPVVSDVINQAGDVSFVIDAMLARSANSGDSLHGLVDASRIAAVGLSLGGLTTQLAAFHRERRDPRIRAAVSMAGPSAQLSRHFFAGTDTPFMKVAGSADAIVPYEENAAPIPEKHPDSTLVTLDRGSHVGFAGQAATIFRWFRHPDRLVCPMLRRARNAGDAEAAPMLAPDPENGITDAGVAGCTMETYERAMRPLQQQMLTRLSLLAFLERELSNDPARRQQMQAYLSSQLAEENPGLTVH